MAQQIQIRRDTSTNWTTANPILAQGELGLETNTNKVKIGDGTTAWNSLNYFGGAGALASLSDVTVTSLASGQVLISNTSNIFINQSLSSLVNEYVSFASLGSLAVMNQLSFTSLTNQPSLSSLAFQSSIDYTTAQLVNKPSLGSLAPMNQLSFTSLINQPSLSSLAFQATVDYSQITNTPSLGSLAIMNQLSYGSLLNLPSLGSLAYLSSVSQIHLPSTASFNNLTINGLQVSSTASINQIRSTGFVTGTATITDVNSGVYNLYESGVQKAIFDGFFGGRFRANASGEAFLFQNYRQLSMTNNVGQEVFKIDEANTIFNLNNFYINTGTLFVGNANATSITTNELVTNLFRTSSVSTGLINTATANTSTLNAGIVVSNNLRASTVSTGLLGFSNATGLTLNISGLQASLVSISDLYSTFGTFDTLYSSIGTFDLATASSLSFDSATGLYMGLGGGLSSQALYIDATNATYGRTAINYPSSASNNSWVGYTFTVNDGTFSGGLYRRIDNADIGIWTQGSGTAPRMVVANNGRVGVANVIPAAQTHIDQNSTTAAIPTLTLEQADLSEDFINFVGGVSTASSGPIWQNATAGTLTHKVRVALNTNTERWLYLYSN